jgi:hypothetical protein
MITTTYHHDVDCSPPNTGVVVEDLSPRRGIGTEQRCGQRLTGSAEAMMHGMEDHSFGRT